MRDYSISSHEDLARLIANISIDLINVDDEEIDGKISDVLTVVSRTVDFDFCGIFHFSMDGGRVFRTHVLNGTSGIPGFGEIHGYEKRGDNWLFQKVHDLANGSEGIGIGMLVPEIPQERHLLEIMGLGYGFMIPLVGRDGPFGFLSCGTVQKREPLSQVEGAFLKIVAKMIANVLEHRKASDSLENSERKMQRIIERLSDDYFFYRHDTNGIFTQVSDSVKNVLGYDPGEFLGPVTKYLTDSPINKKAEKSTQLSIRGIRQAPYEVEVICKNGEIVTLEVQEISIEHEDGKVVAVEGIAHDITRRKQYEELIRRQNEDLERKVKERTARLDKINRQLTRKIAQYEAAREKIDSLVNELEIILDSVPAAIFYKDTRHRFLRVNKAFSDFFGKKKEALKGATYFDLGFGVYSAEEFTREDELIMKTGRAKHQTVTKVVVNNVPKWLVIDKIPYRDINGKIIGIIGFALDVSDFKNAEALIFSLNKRLTEAEEIERLRISRYLHDTVAQNLSSALIDCNILLDEYAGKYPEIMPRFEELSRTLRKSVEQIRHLSYDLRPPHFEKMGITHAIYSFCQEFREKYGIEVDFLSAGVEETEPDFTLQINLYRIVQEALNNIRKHAGAKHVKVRLVASHPHIILRVEDDGEGFQIPESFDELLSRKCMGLQGMQERARLLGGEIQIQSQQGTGTKILVKVPINPEKAG